MGTTGWSESAPDEPINRLFASWKYQMTRPISALLLTWTCFQVPFIEHLVDIRAPDTTGTGIAPATVQVLGRRIAVHRYQHGDDPSIQGAYDHATRTLFWVA